MAYRSQRWQLSTEVGFTYSRKPYACIQLAEMGAKFEIRV